MSHFPLPSDMLGVTMKTKVLFVCVGNACRSQMAEALAKMHGGDRVEAHSAGSRPSGVVNPKAIAAMAELGYDLSKHPSKGLDAIAGRDFDAVVTMGCGDACPHVPARHRFDWQIPDPKHLNADEIRTIRDMIDRQVKELLSNLSEHQK